MEDQAYAGFWVRTGAAVIDSILVLLVLAPILTAIYGTDYWLGGSADSGFWDIVLNYVLPALAVIVFWVAKSATPGKMAFRLSIVDAKTGEKPTPVQFVIRYICYYVAAIPLFIGIIWVGFDRRKQGWHDKIAGTVVIQNTSNEPVSFEN